MCAFVLLQGGETGHRPSRVTIRGRIAFAPGSFPQETTDKRLVHRTVKGMQQYSGNDIAELAQIAGPVMR